MKRSRGKLAVGFASMGLEHKVMKIYAGKKIYAKHLLEEAAVALRMGTEWSDVSLHSEER